MHFCLPKAATARTPTSLYLCYADQPPCLPTAHLQQPPSRLSQTTTPPTASHNVRHNSPINSSHGRCMRGGEKRKKKTEKETGEKNEKREQIIGKFIAISSIKNKQNKHRHLRRRQFSLSLPGFTAPFSL